MSVFRLLKLDTVRKKKKKKKNNNNNNVCKKTNKHVEDP